MKNEDQITALGEHIEGLRKIIVGTSACLIQDLKTLDGQCDIEFYPRVEDTPETVEVPRELLEELFEHSINLTGEWKRGGDGNSEQYKNLFLDIERTRKLLKRAKNPANA